MNAGALIGLRGGIRKNVEISGRMWELVESGSWAKKIVQYTGL